MSDNATEAQSTDLIFHYIKADGFRTIYAEGAYGGLTGRGLIQFSLYNERAAIPTRSKIELTEHGLGVEETLECREGFVREVEASVLMTLENAKAFRTWLDEKINALEAARQGISLDT